MPDRPDPSRRATQQRAPRQPQRQSWLPLLVAGGLTVALLAAVLILWFVGDSGHR